MTLIGLLDVAIADPALTAALRDGGTRLDLVAPPALRPLLGAAFARERGHTVLMVTPTEREAEDLTAALVEFEAVAAALEAAEGVEPA